MSLSFKSFINYHTIELYKNKLTQQDLLSFVIIKHFAIK